MRGEPRELAFEVDGPEALKRVVWEVSCQCLEEVGGRRVAEEGGDVVGGFGILGGVFGFAYFVSKM